MKVVVVKREEKILVLLIGDNKLQSLQVTETGNLLGNIYLGKVQKILPGLNAAFVDIGKGMSCFLQKADFSKIKGNDEIPVQIVAEASKTKQPTASCELTLQGQYCVVALKKPGLSFSSKLNLIKKKRLKAGLEELTDVFEKYHVVIRTNAGELEEISPLRGEISSLAEELTNLLESAGHRTCYSTLWKETESYVKAVRDIRERDYDEIVTDLSEVYDTLKVIYGERVRIYQDEMLSLSKLYSVETHLQNGLARKVWLDLGGFLIIEPTEALTVIDVNTGKYDNKKVHSFLPINMQAAEEIARQIRIRNLSGIIIVDFINMDSDAENEELLSYLRELTKKDSIKMVIVDMTALGLVEITRKKVNKMLWETLNS